jgi:dTDP-4-dehydrorhamnose reductase
MKILITGSNGLLGQKLISLLVRQKGLQVIATARSKNQLPEADRDAYRFALMDVSDRENVIDVIGDYQPDAIIHTAATTHVDRCEQQQEECDLQNVQAVSHLIDACETFQVHLIHLSTDFIFNGEEGPLNEEAHPDPVNYYGESKLKSEKLLQQSSCDWSVVRTVLVYGVGRKDQSNIVLWVRQSLMDGKEIQVVDDQWRTPTLAEDLAEGCYLVAKKRALGVFNISGKDMLTPYQMALQVAEVFGLNKDLIKRTDSNHFKQPARRPLKTGFILDKAKEKLGYSPHSFKEGLQVVKEQLR